jgi:hypothetical protein
MKKHQFFRKTDFRKIIDKKVVPPYKPFLENSEDVSNFNENFTKMDTNSPPTVGDVLGKDEDFLGFSYVAGETP